MRLKKRGMIAGLLSKVVDLVTAIVLSVVNAVETAVCGAAGKRIETKAPDIKREKVCCHTNSMAAVKWTSRKNLRYITERDRESRRAGSGRLQGYAVFKGG